MPNRRILPPLLARLEATRPALSPEVLIHGDLALDNVLVDEDGSLSLIDWSGGDVGDPRYDIALALATEPEIQLGDADVAAFFARWLKDLAADQYVNGAVPWVIPDIVTQPDQPAAGSAGWADAATIIPWTMYLAYADRRVLEDQYPSMTKWVGFMRERAGDDRVWQGDFHFGDWLAFATTRAVIGSRGWDFLSWRA